MDTLKYELLDTGDFKRIESIGSFIISRPAPAAIWSLKDSWPKLDAEFVRKSSGKGERKVYNKDFPESWLTDFNNLKFELKRTSFGHLGLFFEHATCWNDLFEFVDSAAHPVKALNLFAYTGAATLALASKGVEAVHLDASKSSVQWARNNAELSGLEDKPVRWITDDAKAFVAKEVRRGSKYNMVILDPPTYGRGTKSQVWKIEEDLQPLLYDIRKLLIPGESMVLLTSHSPGYTPMALENVVRQVFSCQRMKSFEMSIKAKIGAPLTSGAGVIGYY